MNKFLRTWYFSRKEKLFTVVISHSCNSLVIISLLKKFSFACYIIDTDSVITSNKLILQTMIYFYDPIEVEQDQLIEGSVTLSQSKENARFMNIHLEYAWVIAHTFLKLFFPCPWSSKRYHVWIPHIDLCSCSSGGRAFVKESVMR